MLDQSVFQELCLQVSITDTIPGQTARWAPVPDALDSSLAQTLRHHYPQGLYSHQAEALATFLGGQDICLATPTASGKSLVFMSAATHLLKADPLARVLALYPAKALIQDQIKKWGEALTPHALSAGFIDGSVPTKARELILRENRVILMTPDVLHCWAMARSSELELSQFFGHLRLLIMDEAHVYDGAFGTNMAFLLRRLQAISPVDRLITSTATVGEPQTFMRKLTGRSLRVFDQTEDGTDRPERHITVLNPDAKNAFRQMASLLKRLALHPEGRFLAFADSRIQVERIVSLLEQEDEHDGAETQDGIRPPKGQILPYRAGYEEEDRLAIQQSLGDGSLKGVVATSAMELGLDIGDLRVVVLLGLPRTMRSFWQRIGRVGRRRTGHCLILDDRGILKDEDAFKRHLERPPEPCWLYLENTYLQYANALCAAQELPSAPKDARRFAAYEDLPASFLEMLQNELDQTASLPPDLLPLKQKAGEQPHRAFPIRSGGEKEFRIQVNQNHATTPLGTITHSQYMREAYPGAVYYYLARPYRVYQVRWHEGSISVRREKRLTTRPIRKNKVFPAFQDALLQLKTSSEHFLAECGVQVLERVIGYTEGQDGKAVTHLYGDAGSYSKKAIPRYLPTTGVCWTGVGSEALAEFLMSTFCQEFGIANQELDVGAFQAKAGPNGRTTCQGWCIYDNVAGSLRLTQELAEHFEEVVSLALAAAPPELADELKALLDQIHDLDAEPIREPGTLPPCTGDWSTVFAPGSRALWTFEQESEEVTVWRYRSIPRGIVYEIQGLDGNRKTVDASSLSPLAGESCLQRVNWLTEEVVELQPQPAQA
ncbi:DEAD/DEAH box helicase [Holophaga foetida]|uniref:DEAD/DEAH box helicase n=1 Tax=Holophaga foetida TaxID=35839 RepID=UPI0002471C1E|nr:DEAD/DEAH box helicase [Holophaga foetida]